jgi:zinc D-Ala-D-Ala carboxypeptidase
MAGSDRAPSAGRDALGGRVRAALAALGAVPELAEHRGLELHADAVELVVAHVSASGREHLLVPRAASHWQELRGAAARDGVELVVISAFRSFDRQFELIRAKVEAGEEISKVLRVMAPPGCSEHHSGRAVDIGTPGCKPLSESFEDTEAFAWLARCGARFGFELSYPRGNSSGFRYEPWHWCWRSSGG